MPSSSTSVQELLSGILRFFPNSMIVTLAVLGVATGRLPWILISFGGLLTVILALTFQYMFGKIPFLGSDAMPGVALMEACSLIPVAAGATYSALPSVWVATTSFFATFIFINAAQIYTQVPANPAKKDAIAVQQRKGMGLISMLAVSVLFVALLAPRWFTGCENIGGLIMGLAIGIASGWCWWTLLDACGSAVYPDIHGVQMGLIPGSLRSGPLVCAKN